MINTVMNQLSCGRSASLSLADPVAASWPKGFGCSSPSVRVRSERSLAAVSVRCIGIPGVGFPLGSGCTTLTVFRRGSSRTELSLDRPGAGGGERGNGDGDSERRRGGSSSLCDRGPSWSTGLVGSSLFIFFCFEDFFGYFLLWTPAAASSYRWE